VICRSGEVGPNAKKGEQEEEEEEEGGGEVWTPFFRSTGSSNIRERQSKTQL